MRGAIFVRIGWQGMSHIASQKGKTNFAARKQLLQQLIRTYEYNSQKRYI